jgi:hypothetical protein
VKPILIACALAALASPAAAQQGLMARKYTDPAMAALPNERQREGCRRILANPNQAPADLGDREMTKGAIACVLRAGKSYMADNPAGPPTRYIPPGGSDQKVSCYVRSWGAVTCSAR